MNRIHIKTLCVPAVLLSMTVTATAQDIDFRLSVKYILDSFNNRPSGVYSADSTVQNVINQSNEALKRWGRGYRYVITEFREVSGATTFHNLDEDQSGTEFKGLEDAAEANPAQFHWRTDATNIFIVNTYRGGTGAAAAIPSSPNDQGYELVVLTVNTGPPLVWPHELGHHNALYHTFDEDSVADTRDDPNPLQCLVTFECDLGGTAECCCSLKIALLDAAAQSGGWTQQEYEDLRWNLMNYNAAWDCVPMMDFPDVRMTEGQLDRWTDATRRYHSGDVSGLTYFVDNSNVSPPFTGYSTDPFSTVADGVAEVNPAGGDIVLIRAGTYSETMTITKPVTLRASHGMVTIGQ